MIWVVLVALRKAKKNDDACAQEREFGRTGKKNDAVKIQANSCETILTLGQHPTRWNQTCVVKTCLLSCKGS